MMLFTFHTGFLHCKDSPNNLPSKGLLEFLAEMEEVDGELISAVDLIQENEAATLALTKSPEKEKQVKVKLAKSSSEILNEKQQKSSGKSAAKEHKK